jgi:hypothetical protein
MWMMMVMVMLMVMMMMINNNFQGVESETTNQLCLVLHHFV